MASASATTQSTMALQSSADTNASQLLSADAAKLYDRQIRLWGAASQTRMQAATIVFIGITGLASEVAKNVVLAGVQNITLLDWHLVVPRDLSAQLLLDASSMGQNRATASKQRLNALNPAASVTVVEVEGAGEGQTMPQQAVIDHIKNLARADVVVVSDCYSLDVLQSLNDTCRLRGSTFVVLQSYGLYAHFFCDFGPRHTFKRSGGGGGSGDNTKDNEGVLHYATLQETLRFIPPVKPRTIRERVSKQFYLIAGIMSFVEQTRRLPTLSATNGDSSDLTLLRELVEKYLRQHDITDAFDKKWIAMEHMEDLVRSVNAGETSAVTAVAGGIAGAELIKYLTATDPTLRNWWFYHATTGVNAVESLG